MYLLMQVATKLLLLTTKRLTKKYSSLGQYIQSDIKSLY